MLQAATHVAAEVLGRRGDLGIVAPSARADLLLLDADPTRDFARLASGESVVAVLQDGRFAVPPARGA